MFQPVSRRGNGAGSTAQVNLAPMMDMVFILLIFFVVTTTFARDTGIHVERPQSVHSQSLDSGSLRISITKSGAVHTEGRRVDLTALRETVARFVAREKHGSVILIPDERTSAGRLVEVMDVAKLAGARDVAIATRKRSTR
ncbi:MAG: biopolymer transporter ExbD [Planctomycetota bacterium]